MKNFKKVLALVLAFSMVLSTMTAFAAEKLAYSAEAEVLNKLGLFTGTSTTEFVPNLEGDLTKGDALVLMSRVFAWDLDSAVNTEVKFEDVADYQLPAVKYAVANNVLAGESATVMGSKLDGRILATLVLRELGFERNTAYENALELGFQEGLLTVNEMLVASEDANRDAGVGMFYKALSATPQGETETVIEALVAAGSVEEAVAVATGLMEEPEAEALTFEIVRKDNLKELVLEFSREIEEPSKTNFKVDNKQVDDVKFDDNKKTVTLVMADTDLLKNQEEQKLKVTSIEAVDGSELKKAEVKFTAFDRDLPEVEKIEFVGPREFDVTFSEPIKDDVSAAKVSMKNGKYSVSASATDITGNTMRVKAGTTLKDGAEYLIKISDVEDFADYGNLVYSQTHEYGEIKDNPVFEVVEAKQEYVKVKFSMPVKGVTKEHFYHSYSSYVAVDLEAASTNTYEDTYKVFFVKTGVSTERPLQTGDVKFVGLAKNPSDEKIKDAWGNEFKDQEVTVAITADTTAPEVTNLEVEDKDTLKVVFSEELKEFTTDNVVVKDEDGEVVDLNGDPTPVSGEDYTYTFDLDDEMTGQNVEVTFKDIKDASLDNNKMEEYTETILFTDKEFAGIDKVLAQGKVVYVIYDETVAEDEALDADNYKITDDNNGDAVIEIEDIVPFDEKTVKIETKTDVEVDDKLFTANIKDAEGNQMANFTTYTAVKALEYAQVTEAKLTGAKDVELKFNRLLTSVSEDALRVLVNTTDKDVSALDYNYDKNDTIVKLTLEHAIAPSDLANIKVEMAAGKEIVDIFEAKTTSGASISLTAPSFTSFKDAWAPEVVKVDGTDSDTDADEEAIVTADASDAEYSWVQVVFNEDLLKNSFGEKDIKVNGNDIKELVYVNDYTIKVKVKVEADKLEDKKIVIKSVADADRNYSDELELKISK